MYGDSGAGVDETRDERGRVEIWRGVGEDWRRSRRGRRCFNGGRIINSRQLSRPRRRRRHGTRRGSRRGEEEVGRGRGGTSPGPGSPAPTALCASGTRRGPGDDEPALPFCGDPRPARSRLAGLVSPIAFMYVHVRVKAGTGCYSTVYGNNTVLRHISVTLYAPCTVLDCIETHNTNYLSRNVSVCGCQH